MAVVASAAAATIGGVAYYAYRKSTSGKNASTSSSPKKSSSSKSSKAKKSAGKKQESEDDAFLAASSRNEVVSTESMLDEQTGAEAVAVKHVTSDDDASADNTVAIGEAAADAAAAATDVDVSASQEFKDTPMDDAKREELALAAKNRGNKYYAEKKYQKAIEFYTKGISFYPTADPRAAVLYSNRAACHANLHNYQAVVDDCTKALDADPKYSKALLRRATALEKLEGREVEALHDYTCVALLEQFQNAPAMDAADRLLRTVAKREAEELFKGVSMRGCCGVV